MATDGAPGGMREGAYLGSPGRVRGWHRPSRVTDASPAADLGVHGVDHQLQQIALAGHMAVQAHRPDPERARDVARHNARKDQHDVDPRTLRAAGYMILITSLDAIAFPPQLLVRLYRVRWQIELAFKRFKSLAGLDMLPAKKPELARAWIYARLIVAIIAEQIAGQVPDSSPSGLDNTNDNPIALASRENRPGYDLRRHSWTPPVADHLPPLHQNPSSPL